MTLRPISVAALLAQAFLATALLAAPAQGQDRQVFVFGNSLVHHLGDGPDTSMPYWLTRLVDAGAGGLRLDGTWGFPRDFVADLPPASGWDIDGVTRALQDGQTFADIPYDDILLTPPNFVQSVAPDRDSFDGTMADQLGTVADFARSPHDPQIWLYEGWADMGEIGFPPSARDWQDYHAYNTGPYHDWYGELSALLGRAGRPVGLIPVAQVISALVNGGPLQALGPADLYTDDAPHGTATTYLLAAMVTYAALYETAPPEIALPAHIAAALRDGYAAIAADIHHRVVGIAAPDGASLAPPETGWDNPALAYGLSGVEDWATATPFIDLMKTARPFFGHLPGQWGGLSHEALRASGALDGAGWPLRIPAGVESLEALILTDMPAGATGLAGRYHVTWQGEGALAIGGRATDITRSPHEATFAYTPGPGPVSLTLTATDPADPLRDIRVIRSDHLPLAAAGAQFNPDWLAVIRDARSLRFMDWMKTNGATQVAWDDRPQVSDASYVQRGVPLEVMLSLANLVGADPWFTLPHMADDAYLRAFATMVHQGLDPALQVHAEWSNEVWNFTFPQARWAGEAAAARWGADLPDDAWMQYAGTRAAEAADIWAAVFADAPDRLVRVVATHTGWPGLEVPLLDAPLRQAEGLPAPALSFDAYAVAGYFGFEIGTPDSLPDLRRLIATPGAHAVMAETIRAGSLRELTENLWPHHAAASAARGLDLLLYEAGTHIVLDPAIEDPALVAALNAFNYSPAMASLYAEAMAAWRQLGQGPYMAFVEVAQDSRWGAWGAMRHLWDHNPRAATLSAWNSLPAEGLSPRAGAYVHGVIRRGDLEAAGTAVTGAEVTGTGIAGTEITGTPKADILIGGPGDETFHPLGGHDLVHGGAGRDRVVLQGAASDWQAAMDGAALWLITPQDAVRLVAIEEITFTAAPDEILYPPVSP